MKYNARACHYNMDTGCVELLLRDGRMISIDCAGVEDALDVTMAQPGHPAAEGAAGCPARPAGQLLVRELSALPR